MLFLQNFSYLCIEFDMILLQNYANQMHNLQQYQIGLLIHSQDSKSKSIFCCLWNFLTFCFHRIFHSERSTARMKINNVFGSLQVSRMQQKVCWRNNLEIFWTPNSSHCTTARFEVEIIFDNRCMNLKETFRVFRNQKLFYAFIKVSIKCYLSSFFGIRNDFIMNDMKIGCMKIINKMTLFFLGEMQENTNLSLLCRYVSRC